MGTILINLKNHYFLYLTINLIITTFTLPSYAQTYQSRKLGTTLTKQKTTTTTQNSSNNTSISNNNNNNNNNNNTVNNQPSNNNNTKTNTIQTYDPYLDNHLKAPPDGITIGKFGLSINEIETELRKIGAKYYSYAFGKNSKMILSSYIIIMNFDINKKLGSVEITPKKPLKTIELKAKEFFIKFFTENADLSNIEISVSNNKLILSYISQ